MFVRQLRRVFSQEWRAGPHTVLSRYMLGAMAAAATGVVTGEGVLAREMFRRLRADDFVTGIARLSWVMRRGWPRAAIPETLLHLFCSGMDRRELAAMRRFLVRRKAQTPARTWLAEMAFLSAHDTATACGTPDAEAALAVALADAEALLREVLSGSEREQPVAPPPQPDLDRAAATAALRDTVCLLEAQGFAPFIISGTLLGAVREGAMLEHDYDIDLGLFAGADAFDRLKAVLTTSASLRLLGLYHQDVLRRDAAGALVRERRPVLVKLLHADGVTVDVFLHWHADGQVMHGTALYLWQNSDFMLERRDLSGISVLAPAPPETYLAENYGNWRVPLIDYHLAIDTPNLALHQSPVCLVVGILRLALLQERGRDPGPLLQEMADAGFLRLEADQGWRVVGDFLLTQSSPENPKMAKGH